MHISTYSDSLILSTSGLTFSLWVWKLSMVLSSYPPNNVYHYSQASKVIFVLHVNSVVLSSYVPGCLRIPSPVLELTAHLMETRQAVLPSLNNCTDSKLSQNVAITHHTLYLELAFSLTSPSVCFMLTTDIWSSLSSRVFKEKFFTSPLGSFTEIQLALIHVVKKWWNCLLFMTE